MVPPVPSSTLTLSLLPRTGDRVGVPDALEGGMGLRQEEGKKSCFSWCGKGRDHLGAEKWDARGQ